MIKMSEDVICPLCSSVISSSASSDGLHHHLEQSHGYVKCLQCQETVFISPDGYKDHLAKAHDINDEEQENEGRRASKRKIKEDPSEDKDSKAIKTEADPSSRLNKDPLRGFFLQTVMECKECDGQESRKFSFVTSWNLHLKSHHKQFNNIADYKAKHGDPFLVRFKHSCRHCHVEMNLNQFVMKRHLASKHNQSIEEYVGKSTLSVNKTLDGFVGKIFQWTIHIVT